MSKINFIKTIIPKDAFKKQYELGSLMIYHIGEVLNEEMGAYDCYECSMAISSFDEEEVKSAFGEYAKDIKEVELAQAKQQKLAEIETYDTEAKGEVNVFYLGTMPMWFDKDKRMTIRNGVESSQTMGRTTYDIWDDETGLSFSVPCDAALQILAAVEVYALDCLSTTNKHKAAVKALASVEEVTAYDYRSGYPEHLTFTL